MPYTDGPRMTFVAASGGVGPCKLCRINTSGEAEYASASSADEPVGVTEYLADAGENVSLKLLNAAGTVVVEAAGAIPLGAVVYAATLGRVQALPAVAGSYRRVGIAMEAASEAGERIEIMPHGYTDTRTVS
ncbi:hypothetical protein GGQ74_000086 [Desulfobaculum xiamenense]|uniref:Uncharacterized protein n=1 Tax=Desulfobaculum xiamenense TaxID=995050 RepID=A0A846QCK5_9BACT|nr:DUF2190 family protein [Desulfobaculum xiamenense]NJB66446.1 hypothetical protein [Desulfobaculum xiamenense]